MTDHELHGRDLRIGKRHWPLGAVPAPVNIDLEVEGLKALIVMLDAPAPTGSVMVCSGGVAADSDVPPMLCLSRDLAIEHWVVSMTEWIWENQVRIGLPPQGTCLRWAEYPGIYRYAITLQHESGHRLAAERFAVICRVWIGTTEDGRSLPPEKPAIDEGHER